MYLARTIQKREPSRWVRTLASDPDIFIPLPFTPRQVFDRVIVLHRDDVYVFKLARLVSGKKGTAMCGEAADQPVGDVARIHVVPSSCKRFRRRPSFRGFQGIRYFRDYQPCVVGPSVVS